HRLDMNADMVVASIQTLHRRLDKISEDAFDMIVFDEAHLALSKTWKKVAEYFKPKILLGLTATPKRLDGVPMTDLFDAEAFNYDLPYGINNGWLVPIHGIQIQTNVNIDNVGKSGSDFQSRELSIAINTEERNNFVVDKFI